MAYLKKDFTSGRDHFSHVLDIIIEWRKNRLKIKVKTFPESIIELFCQSKNVWLKATFNFFSSKLTVPNKQV